MEKQTALQIVQALAQGIDPHSGERFPAESPYQHPDTVRALFQAAQALAEPGAARARSPQQGPHENAGKPWTDEEDKALAGAFDAGRAIPELAERHRRTRVAIEARLIRMGKIEPTGVPRFPITPAPATRAAQATQ